MTASSQQSAASPYAYRRRPTRVVTVGDVGIGGANPIRVQSMTTTRGLDTDGTVAQALRLVETGCELVRVTAPGVEDAANLREIAARLRALGVRVPLIADIHFNPQAAIEAAKWVAKVRINPGNYADSRSTKRDCTDAEYAAEIERIEARLLPLIRACKENGVATRVGVNHGSLSGRITSRFGDTPLGMVESALEFVRICERHGYSELVLSMKASNPKVMIQAYRLLATRMDAEGMDYPFHLGVTEAGSGVEARVKSAAGIGALLDDGIGDTIRVSLAESPEAEMPTAVALAVLYTGPAAEARLAPFCCPLPLGGRGAGGDGIAPAEARDPYAYHRRPSRGLTVDGVALGDGQPPAVIAEVGVESAGAIEAALDQFFAAFAGARAWPDLLAVQVGLDSTATAARIRTLRARIDARGLAVGTIVRATSREELAACPVGATVWLDVGDEAGPGPQAAAPAAGGAGPNPPASLPAEVVGAAAVTSLHVDRALALLDAARAVGHADVLLGLRGSDPSELVRAARLAAARLAIAGDDVPLAVAVDTRPAASVELPDGGSLPLDAPIAIGSLFADGIGDAITISPLPTGRKGAGGVRFDPASSVRLTLDCLQAVGARSFKAEIIACPGCGRTLFDLAATTERIKARVGHLVGVKVAVMGCVVNGPGELADADFGYMGGAPGRVSLYVGHECIERNVPADEAEARLVALIQSRGRWVEPGE